MTEINIYIKGNEEYSQLEDWFKSITNEDKKDLNLLLGINKIYEVKFNGQTSGIMGVAEGLNRIDEFKRFVVKAFRNKGLANILLEKLISDSKNKNLNSITAFINIVNNRGVDYLKNKGFQIIGDEGVVSSVMKFE